MLVPDPASTPDPAPGVSDAVDAGDGQHGTTSPHTMAPPTTTGRLHLVGIDVDGITLPAVEQMPRLADGSVAPSMLWDVLSQAQRSALTDHEALELVAAWHRLESATTARRFDALTRFHTTPYAGATGLPAGGVREFAADEIAARIKVGPRSVDRDLSTAFVLKHRLRATRGAFACGRIDAHKAALIADAASPLDDEHLGQFEDRILDRAVEQNPARLRRTLARAVLAIDVEAAERRRRRAHEDRHVSGTPAADGMADLHAHLTGYDWVVINSALNAAARGMKASGDKRSMDQLRADALVAPFLKSLHTGTLDALSPIELARHRGRPLQINVTVPASVLMGLSEAPADLEGYGPIPADLARRLAADGQWVRILTDPATGAAVDVGTTRYTPPESLARLIEARDRSCRFPGCHAQAIHGDLDHTVAFPDGPTSSANLGALCRRHHLMKHQAPGLHLAHDDPGHFTWTLPTGHRYRVDPPRLTELDDPLITDWSQVEPPDDPSP